MMRESPPPPGAPPLLITLSNNRWVSRKGPANVHTIMKIHVEMLDENGIGIFPRSHPTEVIRGHHDLVPVFRVDPLQRPPSEGVPRDVPDHARVIDEIVQFGKLCCELGFSQMFSLFNLLLSKRLCDSRVSCASLRDQA